MLSQRVLRGVGLSYDFEPIFSIKPEARTRNSHGLYGL